MPHVLSRINYKGWYYCPDHDEMEMWNLGTCITSVDAYSWDQYVKTIDSQVLKVHTDYDVIDHGPWPIKL